MDIHRKIVYIDLSLRFLFSNFFFLFLICFIFFLQDGGMDENRWLKIATEITRNTNLISSSRFTTAFGVDPCVMSACYSYLPKKTPEHDLLVSFHFLKNYPLEVCGALLFDINEKKEREIVKRTTSLIRNELPPVLQKIIRQIEVLTSFVVGLVRAIGCHSPRQAVPYSLYSSRHNMSECSNTIKIQRSSGGTILQEAQRL